jgi:murein DD-endopeptidase MepM/ murein hydrolase activator NlpD
MNLILQSIGANSPTIFPAYKDLSKYVPLDLSVNNTKLMSQGFKNPDDYNDFIFQMMSDLGGQVGYGGYFEERRWYQQSAVFDDGSEPRDIHLGLDLWVPDGTEIVAPLDGKVKYIKNNNNFLDYGPTIILEHSIENITFYSLYGHLSVSSLEFLKEGQTVKQGQTIAWVGSSPTNGQWPAHLHLQLMLDLLGIVGDFPGVSEKSKMEMYREICPNPELLLGLKR